MVYKRYRCRKTVILTHKEKGNAASNCRPITCLPLMCLFYWYNGGWIVQPFGGETSVEQIKGCTV